jgi:SAM-dependent methyltransferase
VSSLTAGESRRALGRQLAREHISAGDPLGRFERLYVLASGNPAAVSWADLTPNPGLVELLDRDEGRPSDNNALVIGCGLGDDAEELADRGYETIAFDISPTAIDWCRRRFPNSAVSYVVADLFNAPVEWLAAFSFVAEAYTLQSLPPALRDSAIAHTAGFVAPGGRLLVIARGRDRTEPQGEMPWPLTRAELSRFRHHRLIEISFEDYLDREEPPVRRFRAVYEREVGEACQR